MQAYRRAAGRAGGKPAFPGEARRLSALPPPQPLRHPSIRLAERDPLVEHQAVGLLRGVEVGVEADLLGVEADAGDCVGQDLSGVEREVDASEQGSLEELEVAVVAGGELG